jgi:hypothetical protein
VAARGSVGKRLHRAKGHDVDVLHAVAVAFHAVHTPSTPYGTQGSKPSSDCIGVSAT